MSNPPLPPDLAADPQYRDAVAAFGAFYPRTTRWSETNALALAHASNLAYKDEPTIRAVLASCGFDQVAVRQVRDIQAYTARREGAVVVAFRGTRPDQLLDWMTDFEARQGSFASYFAGPEVGGTHQGFTMGLFQVWALILADVTGFQDQGQTLWIAGHSLGGALAVLCAAAFTFARRQPVNGLYTFGQPRVGDLTFVGQCDTHLGNVHFRFVNNRDVVTRVPPRIFPHLPLPSFYGHSGQVLYFDAQGLLHTDETWWNEFLLGCDVGMANMGALLSAPVQDHDLLNGYVANLAAFVNQPTPGQQKPRTFWPASAA